MVTTALNFATDTIPTWNDHLVGNLSPPHFLHSPPPSFSWVSLVLEPFTVPAIFAGRKKMPRGNYCPSTWEMRFPIDTPSENAL